MPASGRCKTSCLHTFLAEGTSYFRLIVSTSVAGLPPFPCCAISVLCCEEFLDLSIEEIIVFYIYFGIGKVMVSHKHILLNV